MKKKRIVITGGSGRFGKVINRDFDKTKYLIYFPTKSNLNILKINSIKKYLKSKKPNYLIHLAGLSRPMSLHDKNINKRSTLIMRNLLSHVLIKNQNKFDEDVLNKCIFHYKFPLQVFYFLDK